MTRRWRAGVDAENPLAAEWDAQLQRMLAGDDGIEETGGLQMDLCPGETNDGQGPDDFVPAFVRSIPLPEMDLSILPGFAITGLPAYLEVGNQDDFPFVDDIAGWGELSVQFTFERLEVDWGDGAGPVSYPQGVRGEPWNGNPAAQIANTYERVSDDTVVEVTAHWSATWSLAGFDGMPIEDLSTSSSTALPVYEYRAVRVRP